MGSPSRDHNTDFRDVGTPDSGSVCRSAQHSTSPVHVPDSGASSTRSQCSITTFAGTVHVHVSSISLAKQGHSETSGQSEWRDHPDSPPPLVLLEAFLKYLTYMPKSSF